MRLISISDDRDAPKNAIASMVDVADEVDQQRFIDVRDSIVASGAANVWLFDR
jgi:hypothetical protein